MKAARLLIIPAVLLMACTSTTLRPEASIECEYCESWNRPFGAVQFGDNTWYVGVHGLASILIRTDEGLILLDGGLPQSAPMIADNIEALGFSLDDIRLIGLSHAHYDHAGGIASLQRASGARVVARAAQAMALGYGGLLPDDPQFGEAVSAFPAVDNVETVDDGWTIDMAGVQLRAIATPGHTPGGTSWQWTDTADGATKTFAYIDSLTPISADGFLFSDGAGQNIRHSAMRIAELECDVFLAPHPSRFGLHDEPDSTDEYSCAGYASNAIKSLERRLESEQQH